MGVGGGEGESIFFRTAQSELIKNTENESKVSAFFLTHSMDPMYQKKIQPKTKITQINNTHNIIIIESLSAVGMSGD